MSKASDRTDFEMRARERFDASVAGLDGATRSRLAQARARALEAGARRRRPFALGHGLLPVGAAAAAVLAAVLVLQTTRAPDPVVELTAFGDLDILLGEEDLELLEELEFYAWLEEQPELRELPDETDDIG